MAFALQFDGVNDHVTVDFPIPFFNGSTYDATYEWEVASVSGGDVWLAGAGSTNNAIELRPSINTFRVRYNSTEFTFDISGLGLTYNDLNVYRLRGWFDGTTRHMSLHVNDTLVEQKNGVSEARPTTSFDYLGRVGSSSYQAGLLSYASLSDVNDSTNDRFYDARNTSSGSSLPETTANAGDGTLVNFPGDDSQWVDQGGGGTTHEGALTLAASLAHSPSANAAFNTSITLGAGAGMTAATVATLNDSLSLGFSAGMAQSAQWVADALVTLGAQLGDGYAYPSGVVHNASLSLGVSAGDQSGSAADYQAALSLSASLGSALGTQVDWAGELTLSAQLDDGRTANGTFGASITLAASAGQQDVAGLTYNEQITLGAALSDAMAAALLDTTNPHKVFAVQAENRTFSVAVELRTFTVSKD